MKEVGVCLFVFSMVQHIIAVFKSQMRSPLNEQQKKVKIFEVYGLAVFSLW